MKRANPTTMPPWIFLLLPLILLLAACSGSEGGGGGGGGEDVGASAGPAGSRDTATQEEAQGSVTGSEAEPEPADLPSSSGGASSDAAGETLTSGDGFGSRIVKSAEIGLRAEDVRGVAETAQRVAANRGGSVLVSEISGSDEQVSAYMTLSVPAEEFEGVLGELRRLGKNVVQDTVSGQDVTEEYVDLESRERNLLAAERSLLDLYGRAETVEDTLTIERELTNVRGQIEQVQGRLEYLENRTSFSQISVSVEPVAAPQPTQQPGWDPSAVAAEAWAASLVVLQGIASAAIAALAFGWWTLPLLVGGYVWWRRRRTPATS